MTIKIDMSAWNSISTDDAVYFYIPLLNGWVHINDVTDSRVKLPIQNLYTILIDVGTGKLIVN